MAQLDPKTGLLIPGYYGPPALSPEMEELFDHYHPKHAGHRKWMPSDQLDLRTKAICVHCNLELFVTLMAAIAFEGQRKKALAPAKDDRYPHACPRCKGPAYVGGNNNVDCKRRCS